MRTIHFLAAVAACLALAGCGGGGGSGDEKPDVKTGQLIAVPSPPAHSCAPNVCVYFTYIAGQAPRLLTSSAVNLSTQSLEGHAATFRVIFGDLPPGMALDPVTGTVHGTPTTNGEYDASVEMTVSGMSGTLTSVVHLSVVEPTMTYVVPSTPIGPQDVQSPQTAHFLVANTPVTNAAMALGTPNMRVRLDPIPGAASHLHYDVIGSQGLPPGLALDPATGAFTGTPTQAGIWLVQVKATLDGATFTKWAPICVGAYVQEHIGQAAAASVQMSVHNADNAWFLIEKLTTGGVSAGFEIDRSTNVMTLTPEAVPAGALPAIDVGAFLFYLTAPDGNPVMEGYVIDLL